MAPPQQKSPAANDQHGTSLELLKESYQALEKFHKTICQKAQGVSLNRSPRTNLLSIVQELLEHFKMIIDHQTGNPKDDARLVKDSSRLCYFFRHQAASLYELPLKNIFSAIKPASPVKSSPILGLMSYIYEVKLERCQGPFSLVRQTCVNDDSEHPNQCWERILAAFGEGIRIFMNNHQTFMNDVQHDTKTREFQVLVGNVFYRFLAQVVDWENSTNPHRLSEYVQRSLLDAGEALSVGSEENKELIQDPTIFGPARLSQIIFNHSDFITANTALRLSFVVAPPLKMINGLTLGPKDTKTARRDWFMKIFPADKFGKTFQEETVSQLVSMSSKQFWVLLGDIEDQIFQNDHSRTVHFNKHSLTWSSWASQLGDHLVQESEEITAEISYRSILAARLTGIPECSESLASCTQSTLSIDFRAPFPVKNCAPAIHYPPDSNAIGATLVLTLDSRSAHAMLSILRERKIPFSYPTSPSQSPLTGDEDDGKIVYIQSPEGDCPRTNETIQHKTSIEEPVCLSEPEHPCQLPPCANSSQRGQSVQRVVGIDLLPEEDSNRSSKPIIASAQRKCQIVRSHTREQVVQEPKSNHIRILESSNDSVDFSPVDQCRKKLANEPRNVPASVTPQTRRTEVKPTVGVIPLLEPMKTLTHSIGTRKESKEPARGASEDIIQSYSDAEGKEVSIRSESINSIPDDYGQFKTDIEAEPTLYHNSREDDEILRSSQSSDHNLGTKITNAQPGRKLNRLSVLNSASGSCSVAQNEESGRIRKSQTRFRKQFNQAQTEPLEGLNPKTTSQFKVSPTKRRLEGDSFSPKTNPSSQTPTFDSDIRAKHLQNHNNSKELNGKNRRISESLKMSDMRRQSARQKDKSSSSSTIKKLTRPSIPSGFTGMKHTVQTRSSAKLTAKKKSNPWEDGRRPLTISEASGSKGLGGMTDMGVALRPHLSRTQSGTSQRSKEFLRKPDDPIQAKNLRFQLPQNVLAPPNVNQSRSDKSGLFKMDSRPLVEEAHIRDVKQRKFLSDISNDKNNLFKSAALNTSTPSRSTPRCGLKDSQKKSEKKRIGSSSMVAVKQQLPEGLYQDLTTSEKVENVTSTQTSFLIESSVDPDLSCLNSA